jgi:hypothetical protein
MFAVSNVPRTSRAHHSILLPTGGGRPAGPLDKFGPQDRSLTASSATASASAWLVHEQQRWALESARGRGPCGLLELAARPGICTHANSARLHTKCETQENHVPPTNTKTVESSGTRGRAWLMFLVLLL